MLRLSNLGKYIAKPTRLNRFLSSNISKWSMTIPSSNPSSPNNETSSKHQRLYNLMEHYKDKPAGMWHELYHAQVFLRDLFDSACDSDEGREFARNWCQIRAYICGGSRFSKIEKAAIVTECVCWCPSISQQEFEKLCDSASELTFDEVQKLCDAVNKSYPIEARKALLLNSLCGASLDGLSFMGQQSGFKFGVDSKEIGAFTTIAKQFGVDDNTAHEIFQLYTLESKLKHKYDEFYNNTQI